MSQFGRYEIVRKTGNHGLDALYEAFDPVMKRNVTIRVPEHESAHGDGPAEPSVDFVASQIAALDHPNIVRVLAFEESEDLSYVVLEQPQGVALNQSLSGDLGDALPRMAVALRSAASALDHIHINGLVHGHLTGESLIVSEVGVLKVNGLDVARPANEFHSNSGSLSPGVLLPAVPYLAPELLLGEPLDGRADQYSLACIALEALTGAAPFPNDSYFTLMREIITAEPNLNALRGQGFPPALAGVFARALAKAPAARFSNCEEFAAAFEHALTAKAAAAPTRIVSTERTVSTSYGSGGATWTPFRLIVAGSVVVAAIVAFFVIRTLVTKPPQPDANRPAVAAPITAPAVATPPPAVDAKGSRPDGAPKKASVASPKAAAPPRRKISPPPAVAPPVEPRAMPQEPKVIQ